MVRKRKLIHKMAKESNASGNETVCGAQKIIKTFLGIDQSFKYYYNNSCNGSGIQPNFHFPAREKKEKETKKATSQGSVEALCNGYVEINLLHCFTLRAGKVTNVSQVLEVKRKKLSTHE